MQSPNRQQTKRTTVPSPGQWLGGPGKNWIDPQALHQNLCGRHRGITPEKILPIEFGNRHAEFAGPELGLEEIGAIQQVGAVQRETEIDPEQASRDQRHPGSEVSVMTVDMIDLERR